MAQTFTSAATSINASRRPAVFGKLPKLPPHSLLLDYGCGRYTDHIAASLPGVVYLPFDPYNQPDDVNRTTLSMLAVACHTGTPVTVTCSNVLNVIDDDETLHKIAAAIMGIVYRTGGKAYITVYEGDRSYIGRQTGPDQYQRNEPLREYLRLFPTHVQPHKDGSATIVSARIIRGMIVVRRAEVGT